MVRRACWHSHVTAPVAHEDERARLWRLMSDLYAGFDLYAQRTDRDIKVFVLDPSATVLIVVDMQNDFASRGGMFDRAGIPIDAIQTLVEPIRRVVAAGRAAGMRIVFLKMQFAADLSDAGAPETPSRSRYQWRIDN